MYKSGLACYTMHILDQFVSLRFILKLSIPVMCVLYIYMYVYKLYVNRSKLYNDSLQMGIR